MEKTEQKGKIERLTDWLNTLSVKGLLSAILVAFVVIIILISLSLVPRIMSGVSSSLSAALYSIFVPTENAAVTADKKIINSGEDFTVSFKKNDTTAGLFAVSYACDASIDLVSVENAGLKEIPCDAPYYLLNNVSSIQIRPTTKEAVTRLVLNASFENSDTQKIESIGVVRVTIKNDSVGTVVTPSNSTSTPITVTTTPSSPTYTPAPVLQPTYYGTPDLAARLLQVGLLNNGVNLITPQNQFHAQDMVGIKFEVRNDGDAATGPWSFAATLPSLSTPIYNSPTQISLRPGESIIFTLGFSNLTAQEISTLTINVDPQNTVNEKAEYNNIITATITNLDYRSNYYNNYNYSTGCYVNGFFTYNCNNNNNGNNYYNDNNNNDLQVTCNTKPNSPSTGDRVNWNANASGGAGGYTYHWSGTNNLNSSLRNTSKTYSTRGDKNATVTVTDDNDNQASATCSTYVD